MSTPFGFGGHSGVMGFIFGTPIGPRQVTLGEVFGRKAVKQAIKDMMPAEDKKSSEYNPILGKLAFCSMVAKLAEFDKEAPFKSEAQRRKFYAMASRGEISKEEVAKWESETPDEKLPERLHKKEAGALLARGAMAIGKGLFGVGKAMAKPALKVTKSMFIPTTKKQVLLGGTAWNAKTFADSASMHQPNVRTPAKPVMQFPGPSNQIQQVAADLLEMTKQALEMRSHGPMSTDTAGDEDVKKKSLSKDSSLVAPVSRGVNARAMFGSTKGPSSRTANDWLKRSTTGDVGLNIANDAPKNLAMAGEAALQSAGRGAGPHIQRG